MPKKELTQTQRNTFFNNEFLPHVDALYNFAFHLTFNNADANDLVQDTFLKAFRFIDGYRLGTNAKAWLFKILKNSFINDYRKKGKQPFRVDFEDFLAYQEIDNASHVGHLDLRQEVFKNMLGDEITQALNSLPVNFKTAILLCDIEGFSYEEIANIVDIPIGTVRSRLHRARKMLKDKLKAYAESMGFKTERSNNSTLNNETAQKP